MSVDKSFSWQVLYESGDVLVECLLKHAENPDVRLGYSSEGAETYQLQFQQRPLVFICHSLGGLVVKRVGFCRRMMDLKASLLTYRGNWCDL